MFSPRSSSVARALSATTADDNVVADDDYDDDDDDDNAETSVFPRTLFATLPYAAAPARANTVPPGSGSWRARYRRRFRHRPVARAAFATRPLTGVSRSCRRSRHYRHGRRTRLTAECRPHAPMRFDILLTTKVL